MKRRRSLFLHLNQLKLLAKKFALVILFLAALALMLFSKNQNPILEQSTGATTSLVGAIVDVLVVPAKMLARSYGFFSDLATIKKDNRILLEENRKLRLLKDKYEALEVENKLLSDLLNYVPLPEVDFVSVRVVAEESDAFAHSMVAYIGNKNVAKGDVVLSDRGVVGRVDKVAPYYAKIILITDINSNIPVMTEKTRIRGVLSGDNTTIPKLVFVPLDAEISVGDRIVTSGVSGVFPAGLPVGQVMSVNKSEIKVKPFTTLEKLEYVRVVKYGIEGLLHTSEEETDE